MPLNVGDIKTVEQLDEWVKYRAATPEIYKQYHAALEAGRDLVAVQYPGRKFDWPAPTLQPAHAEVEGVKRNMFVHWYEFPDGFKTGCLLVMGLGEYAHVITSVVFVDPSNEIVRGQP
jgi:hypothetical protein